MSLNEFNWFVFGLVIGYAWYVVWNIIKTIWRNAKEETAKNNQQDPYQDPKNWGA